MVRCQKLIQVIATKSTIEYSFCFRLVFEIIKGQ